MFIKIASQLDWSLCRLDLASDIVIHPSHQKSLVSSRSGLNLRGRMRDPALKSSLAQAVEQDQPCSSTPLGGRNMGQGMMELNVEAFDQHSMAPRSLHGTLACTVLNLL